MNAKQLDIGTWRPLWAMVRGVAGNRSRFVAAIMRADGTAAVFQDAVAEAWQRKFAHGARVVTSCWMR